MLPRQQKRTLILSPAWPAAFGVEEEEDDAIVFSVARSRSRSRSRRKRRRYAEKS